ncbi:Lnb N-terminal periplasmic domain-containing protein [Flavobacterium restrictum]|uniref:DUF4105 domain-containing protein n=1 Tax=Flavobacterium restrictum TaxID=2594428 RepID=A0A553E893_9FLAO|nr:DUF4105 domain-containing protein [Flavobacterium restrictum]TRX41269.1 DUF4105 domain-containing protein [Flavobacterium restrictum]
MKRILHLHTPFIITFLLIGMTSFSQNLLLSKDAKISVVTCGTGNESYSLFGHTAIHISDPYNAIDVAYNYGAFDFSTPNFVAKFAKGDLQYFMVAYPFSDFIKEYQYEKRSVYEQELNISVAMKQKLFDKLNATLQSDERYYTYKFIDKNCTSMVIDLLNTTLGGSMITKKATTTSTYRAILYPYFDHHFYEQLGTSIIFGKKVDAQATTLFLPFELLENLKTTRYANQKISKPVQTILSYPKEIPFSWWNNAFSYCLILLLIAGVRNKKIDVIYLILMGLLGLFFLFMGVYSNHLELEYNYNILLFNPTLLALLYFTCSKNTKWVTNLAVFNLLSLGIYVLILVNKAHLFIVIPLVLNSSLLLFRLLQQNRKKE